MTVDLLKADAESRLRALDLASFIVEAPAGAGKTELLTQRYLKLLPTVKQPEEIIAITFTNKAAAEMRLRILDSLIAAANLKKPPEAHKQITYELSLQALQHGQIHDWQLIENPARLRIFTIDSLCAHLARQMPLMSRFGAQPRVSDDTNNLYALAAAQTLALLEDVEYKELIKTVLRYVDNDSNKLSNLLVLMLAKRDQWLTHAQGELDAALLQQTLDSIVAEVMQAAESAVPAALQQLIMPIAHFAAGNLLTENELAVTPLMNWQTPLQAVTKDLNSWRALADFLLTNTGEPRKEKGLNIKFGFPPTPTGKAQKMAFSEIIAAIDNPAALHRVRNLPNVSNTNWQIISTLSRLLNLAVAQLWLVFQRAGEVDFVEIAQRATQALTDNTNEPTELALKLDYQIQHLLVDEFQDTSPSQIALLQQITLGWQPDDGRTLFCVGDPMQSIYRFRKANVGLFIDAATLGIGDIKLKKLQLFRNNRSCPPIVNWINATFENIFPMFDNVTQGAIHYRPFIATKLDNAESGVEICAIIKQNDETAEAAKQREAAAVIELIKRERSTNPNKKIAILVRSKKHLLPLVSQLRRLHQDIAFQAVEIEALAGRQIVQDLLSLTHALHHRADRVHWLAVLRAPWCGLKLCDLHRLAGGDHYATIWQLMQNDELVNQLADKDRLLHVRTIFAQAFATQGRMNISRWLRGIWLMLNGTACLWEHADIVDVQAFFSCLDALDRSNQFSPERMTVEITKLFATPDMNGENLQMMSIHKSKGLEFDTVILLGLGAETGGNNTEKPLILWEEVTVNEQVQLLVAPYVPKEFIQDSDSVTAYDYLATLEAERDTNEAARVLYVAVTRAERQLYLVGIANQNAKNEVKPTKNTYLDLMWNALSHEFEVSEVMPTETSDIMRSPQKTNLESDFYNNITNFTPNLIRLKQLQIPSMLLAESAHPNQTIICKTSKLQNNMPVQNTALNIAADAGTLAHLYMQIIANDGLNNWPVSRIDACLQSMQFWLLQCGHGKNACEQNVGQIIAALKCTLTSPHGAWILSARTSMQTELSIINAEQEQRIDITFIDDDGVNQTRWIIDYKLGFDVTQANANIAALAHQPQLAGYAALFAHDGLPIKMAVYFLSLGKLVELN